MLHNEVDVLHDLGVVMHIPKSGSRESHGEPKVLGDA